MGQAVVLAHVTGSCGLWCMETACNELKEKQREEEIDLEPVGPGGGELRLDLVGEVPRPLYRKLMNSIT